jgi:large subunit ribosomal protein L15
MRLGDLRPAQGAVTATKRLGRGIGSGLGKTSGKGHKGQWARSGGGVRPGFEGGQMPLTRRIPKRGFNNYFKKSYSIVNLSVLDSFEANSVVDINALIEKNLIKVIKDAVGLKVLATGAITKPITVKANAFSKAAKEAIEKAGGKVEQI